MIISKCKDDKRIKELWDIPVVLSDYITETDKKRLDELDELYWENPDDMQKLGYDFYLKDSSKQL